MASVWNGSFHKEAQLDEIYKERIMKAMIIWSLMILSNDNQPNI